MKEYLCVDECLNSIVRIKKKNKNIHKCLSKRKNYSNY